MQIIPRSPFGIALIWVLSFGVMATVIGVVTDAPHLLALQHEHAETVGEVTRLLPETHGLLEVKYTAAGTEYQHTFTPHLQPHAVGDKVRVYYSPHDPAIAFIAPPGEILTEELPSWLAGSLLISVGLVAAVLMLWSPAMPFHRLSTWVVSPKIISAGVTIGVFAGLGLSVYSGELNTAKLVGGVFVVAGCMIFLKLAWSRKLSWAALLRSPGFWIGFASVVVGNILNSTI